MGFPCTLAPRSPRTGAISGNACSVTPPRCCVPGAPPGRGQRRSRLHLPPAMVLWYHGDTALTVGTLRETGHPRAPATRPSGALWGLPSAAQPPAWGDHPDPTSARHRRAGGWHRVVSLELVAAASFLRREEG